MAKKSRTHRAKRTFNKLGRRATKRARAPHIPLPLLACAVTDARFVYDAARGGFTPAEVNNIQFRFSGTGDGVKGVDYTQLGNTYGKYGAAIGIHILATKLGVNKYLYKMTRGYVGL
jgi:hypothetical protein